MGADTFVREAVVEAAGLFRRDESDAVSNKGEVQEPCYDKTYLEPV